MRKLTLAICLLSVAVPFAAAKNGGSGSNGGNDNGKPKGHAPEMSGTAMTVAGMIALGGYFLIRRRISPQN